jgi:hypothetical protein
LGIGIAWLVLRSRRRSAGALRAALRAANALISAVCFGFIPLFLVAVLAQGGSAINTERLRAPGQYLPAGNGTLREVAWAELTFSWAVGYGTVVAGVLAARFVGWLRWYTAPGRTVAEPGAAPGRAGTSAFPDG